MVAIRDNLERVRAEIAAAALAVGRRPESVRLIAVSKTMPPAAILAAYAAGQRDFGENKVQEYSDKSPRLPADIAWHLIGHLQRNKAKPALGAALLHALDSDRLAERLDALALEAGLARVEFLIQVNVTGEVSKSGVVPAGLEPLLASCLRLPRLRCRGLMTMARFEADGAELHRTFAALREARDRLAQACGVPLPELSMGMSGDFREAIAEGATLVRIGTAIFGSRPVAAN